MDAINSANRAGLRGYITNITTEQWTPELRDRMDDKNLRLLAKLQHFAQEIAIRLYTQNPEVRNEQKHAHSFFSGVIRSLEEGVSYEEGARVIRMASAGNKVSYNPSSHFTRTGSCRHASECMHLHVTWTRTRRRDDAEEPEPDLFA